MSNQEMQFADPDWKPSQQLDPNTNQQEREEYHPQPINTDYREQNQWRTTTPAPPQEEGYTGLRPNAGTAPQQMQGGNFRPRPYRRRGRGPWLWIILAFIIISLMSGGWRSFNGPNFNGPNFGPPPFAEKQIVGKPISYAVTGQPTIFINNTDGNVQVTVGKANMVIIQAVNRNNPFGNPNPIQPVSSLEGNTITASIPDSQPGSADLQVTVPQDAILKLQTGSGDINVTGVEGPMTLTTNSGSVDLALPSNSPFHVDASTNSGSITSDFPGVVPVQINNTGPGEKATGDINVSSQHTPANVTIIVENGDINLHQG
jgi:hypothetical protein